MMKAIVQGAYGSPEVLALEDVERPVIGDNEVLVRVHGASVNAADWIFLTGKPYLVRLVSGLLRPRTKILGRDVAGKVEAVGRKVTRFRPGDEVFGENVRAYAEYVCAPEDGIALKPRNLSFEQAAAVPVAAITALQGLRDRGKVKPGHAVLINGASGGVGTFAVQIARALGAEVTGVCSTRNVEMVRSIGAQHVVDYTREDFTRSERRYDLIFDLAGSRPPSDCARVLKPGGIYMSSVGRTGWILKTLWASLFSRHPMVVLAVKQTPEDLGVLRELIESGSVTPVIDRCCTLSEVPAALRAQGEGHAQGKTVIKV